MAADWLARLKGKRDKIPGDERTLVEALDLCPETAGAIAWDKRRGHLAALRDGAWGPVGAWTSTMTVNLLVYFQTFGIPAKERPLDRALAVIGSRRQVDPLGDWLGGLSWDGKLRLDTWLITCAGAEDDLAGVTCMVGAKFLIGMVARALVPGCQCDHALCLEGEQGAGKSQIARVLGGEYHSEDLPNFHSRDAQQIASSHWLLEVGELAAVRRSDLERCKSFLSTTTDTFVPKYERWPVTRRRWCSFLFTVNPDGSGYLVDSTGNRRIWPIKVGKVDIEALKHDRDQLFAEALCRYRKGEKWWPENKVQWEALGIVQAARRTEDAWTPIIAAWLDKRPSDPPITTTEVLTHALEMKPRDIEQSHSQRVGKIMRALGYERYQERSGPLRGMWFYRLAPTARAEGDSPFFPRSSEKNGG
jgi:predicted P-loop ATPase